LPSSSADSPDAIRQERTARRENVVATLFAILGICTLFGLTYLSLPAFGGISDLPEYYAPAKLILEGKGALGYTIEGLGEAQHRFFPSMGGRIVALFVPPQGLALVSPIALVSPDASRFVWKSLLVLCLAASIFLLRKTFELSYKQTCYLIAAMTLSDVAYNSLRIDQLAPILLLSYVAAIHSFKHNKNISAGIWLSLIVLKPQQFLPFLAYLAGAKKFKPLFACAGIVAALSLVSLMQIGQTGWSNYFALVSSPSSVPFMQPELTPTVRGQLLRLFPAASGSIFSLTAGIYLFSIALAALVGWKLRDKKNPVLLGVVGVMPLGLVLSMHCHTYDLLLLIPTILLIFNDAVIPFGQLWKLAVMLGAIVFMLPLSVEIQHEYLLKGGQFNPWFFLLLPLAVALLVRVLKRPKSGQNE